MKKPVLTQKELLAIFEAGHRHFLNAKKMPENTVELRIYLILRGLEYVLQSMKVEVPFELENMDADQLYAGGLDDIG